MSDNAREALYAIQRAGHTYKIKGDDLYDKVREGDIFVVERNGIAYKYVYENSSGWVYYGEDQGIDKQSGWRACAAGNGIAVVVSDGYAGYVPGQMAAYSTSPNLDSWQMIGNDNGIPNNQWTDIAFADGKFIAVARGGQDAMTQAIVSTDGINWTGRGIFDGMDYQNYNYGVAYGDGTWLIVSTNRNEGFTSTDGGDNWTKVSIPCRSMHYVAFGNGRFVVVSNSQSVGARSTDASATSWETFNLPQNPSGSDLKWQDVAYGNGTWVAIVYGGNEGEGSAAAYSTDDAQTWNFTNDGIRANKYDKNYAWNRVTFGDGIFVAVSDNSNSSIMQSSDGITWIGNDLYETTHDKRNWSGIAYTGDKWFCVNYSGTNSSKGPVAVSAELNTIDTIRDSDQFVCWYEDQNYKVSGDVFKSMMSPPEPELVWETIVVTKGKLLPEQDYFEGYTVTGTTAEFERVASEVTNFAPPDGFRYRWQTKSVWNDPDEKWTNTSWVSYDGLPVDVDFVLPTPCGRVRLQSQANYEGEQVQNFTTSREVFVYYQYPWQNREKGQVYHIKNVTGNALKLGATFGNPALSNFTAWDIDGTNERIISEVAVGEELVFVTKMNDNTELFAKQADTTGTNWDFGEYTDTTGVTTVYYMFGECDGFNGELGGIWDLSLVEDTVGMFFKCAAFNQDIGSWEASSWESTLSMFRGCSSFNQDISGWNIQNVTYVDRMFQDATSFNQDLSQWCVSNCPSPHSSYDEGASSWTLPRPVWGTCPRGEDQS